MISPGALHAIISGKRRDPAARLLRCVLRAAEPAYTTAIAWRNRRYDRNPRLVRRVSVPVVSVGNITTGGTGKTPMVAWLAARLVEMDWQCVILSRGYANGDAAENDEARVLAAHLPGVAHLQNADRVEAANRAVREFGANVLLLDDGFQHRRLARDLDIVLLDALEPFGFGHLLPRGLLREPLSSLSRADVIALSRADLVPLERREAIRRRAMQFAPEADWVELRHRPTGLVGADGTREPLELLTDQPVAAFCGIGNPQGFRRTLERLGCRVLAFREYPDHHRFSPSELVALARWADRIDCRYVLCTEKDLVKLASLAWSGKPLLALRIEVEFLGREDSLWQRLERVLSSEGA